MKYFLSAVIVFFFVFQSFGQRKYSTENKRAIKYYEEAIIAFDQFKYAEGYELMDKAIKSDKNFIEAYLVLAEMKTEQKLNKEAIRLYYQAQQIKSDFFPTMYYNLSKLEMIENDFESAKRNLEKFVSLKNISAVKRDDANRLLKSCEFAINAVKNPVPFTPVNMGDSINSRFSEYWPSITADGNILVITRMVPIKNANNQYITDISTPEEFVKLNPDGVRRVFDIFQEDFFVSFRIKNYWSFAQELGSTINTKQSEGAQSLTSDGNSMYFTACNRSEGLGHCDIYTSKLINNEWNEPVNIGSSVNSESWDAQPSISPDGKTLYFVSDRKGGYGGKDIWFSTLLSEGKWSNPLNLGEKINTSGDEQSPFIHFDNKTLYFSSNGHLGMGGSDIFISRRIADGSWSDPVNIGYPINSIADEIGFIVTANGEKAFFSSDRLANKGRDIFEFELYKEARPIPVSYLKGKVYDAEDLKKLNAHFELIDLNSQEIVMQAESDKTSGEFLLCIPTDNDYLLNVSKEGYLFYSDNFSLKGIHEITNPFLKDVALNPIKKGQKIVLRNIFYLTDSYQLQETSQAELSKLVEFLSNNPSLKIEISGHTDNVGSDEYNLKLSENRARSVVDYLISKDIQSSRLIYKGYGEMVPIDSNDSETGRANNRRTEIKIL